MPTPTTGICPTRAQKSGDVTLAILSYGNIAEYWRALFSLESLFSQAGTHSLSTINVLIFTDNPGWFRNRFHLPRVDYVFLDAQTRATLLGNSCLDLRMKPAIVKRCLEETSFPVVLIDSDTFTFARPDIIFEEPEGPWVYLHSVEYPLSHLATIDDLDSRRLFSALEKLDTVPQKIYSWNSGVIGITPGQSLLLDEVLALTDQLYDETASRFCEQWAFSVIFGKEPRIGTADQWLYHYWHPAQKWAMDHILREEYSPLFDGRPWAQRQLAIRELTQRLPGSLFSHPAFIRRKSLQCLQAGQITTGLRYALIYLWKGRHDRPRFIRDVLYWVRARVHDGPK